MSNFPIIDTHTHGYFGAYDDVPAMLQRARDVGVVAQIQIGCDERASCAAMRLATEHSDCFATVGLHPTDVRTLGSPDAEEHRLAAGDDYQSVARDADQLFELFEKWIAENPNEIVGIGECGFDFYHDERSEMYDRQRDILLRHCTLARRHDLPVVLHVRDAIDDFIEFWREHGTGLRGVLHCFSGEAELAQIATEEFGLMLGVGGILTYKKSEEMRETVAATPLEFLITETDAPFLPPQNWRKRNSTNEPAALPEVVELIAELHGRPVEAVAERLVDNARKLFGI